MTYTYATLEVSNAAFKEIIEKLRAAGYERSSSRSICRL